MRLDDLPSPDPFWTVRGGHFHLPDDLSPIRSSQGRLLAQALAGLDNGVGVFLRGSLLESPAPFARADADLLVRYETSAQLSALSAALPTGFEYDVKLMRQGSPDGDFVLECLLECRSCQLCGPVKPRLAIPADKSFAWQHWLKYCPALLPGRIDTGDRAAIIHFKLLARCFGVLSFLRDRRFTRNIGPCLELAAQESPEAGAQLVAVRRALEERQVAVFRIDGIKRLLHEQFDVLVKNW
jgi:hypothetical protein